MIEPTQDDIGLRVIHAEFALDGFWLLGVIKDIGGKTTYGPTVDILWDGLPKDGATQQMLCADLDWAPRLRPEEE